MSEGPIIGDWTQYEWIPDNASSFPARIRLRDTAWMVYYEPDVTGLKAEVLMLRKENERLRKAKDTMHGDAFEIGAMLVKARDENAKLRELVDELYPLADYGAMDESELDRAHDLMRELGVEL